MTIRAPGKLVITGAYAVLYGARAVVFAVDRYARSTESIARSTSPEFRAAMPEGPWPVIDTSEMVHGGIKMGLGSSAASLVVALAMRSDAGDLSAQRSREVLFERAHAAHRAAQGGGSGVDIAASVWGGAQILTSGASRRCSIAMPARLQFRTYFSGASVKTSTFVARVEAARSRPEVVRILDELAVASERAASAFASGEGVGFVEAAALVREKLLRLGNAAEVPIVTPLMSTFHERVLVNGAVALPAGAGGGDVVVALTTGDNVNKIDEEAISLGLTPLDLQLDHKGVSFAKSPFLQS